MNVLLAVLLLPQAVSVYPFAPTLILFEPIPDGVNVAVYTVVEVAEKLLNDPPLTVTSSTVKLAVARLEVNVNAMVVAVSVAPLLNVEVIVIVGATVKPVSRVIVSLPTSEINKFPFAYTYKSLGAEYESDMTTPVVAPLVHFTTLSLPLSRTVIDPSELDSTKVGLVS